MSLRKNAIIVLFPLVTGIVWFLSWLHKTVELVIEGQSYPVTRFAITVQDVLSSEGVILAEGDRLSIPPSHWLAEGEKIVLTRAELVSILADDRILNLLTTERSPQAILAQAGIQLQTDDIILVDGKTVPPGEILVKKPNGEMPALHVQRAVSFDLQEGDHTELIRSAVKDLGTALWDAGIRYYSSDKLIPDAETQLKPGLETHLLRSRIVTITLQEGVYSIHSIAETVGEALAEAGLSLQGLDYSIPADHLPIPPDGKIQLIKVNEEVIIEQTPIPFDNQYQAVAELEIDRQQIIQAGEPGIKANRIRIRYENGQEVSRQIEEEWTARLPRPQITGYGTKIVQLTADTPDGTITYWRAIQMYAVSYHPAETGSNVTASGMILKKGLVAVDTRYIPFFTRLYIPGYGEAVAADRGGGVVGRIIDLGYSDQDYVPWHQNVTVYFLWPPPENIVWIIP